MALAHSAPMAIIVTKLTFVIHVRVVVLSAPLRPPVRFAVLTILCSLITYAIIHVLLGIMLT